MGDWADYYVDGPGIDRNTMGGYLSYGRNGKTKPKKVVSISLNEQQYAKFKALGGAVALRKLLIDATPPPPSTIDAGDAR